MAGTATPAKDLVVLAIAAHPDDIEFYMAGTLLLFEEAGAQVHLWNLANGCCGSEVHGPTETAATRWQESQASAALAGATIHPSYTDDITIFHDDRQTRLVTAKVRQLKPNVVLTHSPQDYMEDHMNAGRLAVTGAFCRGMPNYRSDPPLDAWSGNVAVYHTTPHGLRDPLRRLVRSEIYVDIESVFARKRAMLACHKSQKEWLDASQGMDVYLIEMEEKSKQIGELSGHFAYAEGWRRHLHLGLAPEDYDPVTTVLGDNCWVDPEYVAALG